MNIRKSDVYNSEKKPESDDDKDDDKDYDESADSDYVYEEADDADDDDDDDYLTENNSGSGEVNKFTSFENAYVCTPELAEFIGAPLCNRLNVIHAINQYVRERGLRHGRDKKIIHTDSTLRNLFNVHTFTNMQLGALLNHVLRKPHPVRDSRFQHALRVASEKTLNEKILKSSGQRTMKRQPSSDG